MPNALGHAKAVQICIIVKDLKTAMERYRSLYGIDEYSVYTVDTRELPGVIYRGKPADYGLRVALAKVGHWQLELLEPLRGGNSSGGPTVSVWC